MFETGFALVFIGFVVFGNIVGATAGHADLNRCVPYECADHHQAN